MQQGVRALAVLILGWQCLPSAEVGPEDWPMFRGPNGTGVLETGKLPSDLGPGKHLAWKVPLPFARSSPIVVGNRLFLTGHDGDKLITISLDVGMAGSSTRKCGPYQRRTSILVGRI